MAITETPTPVATAAEERTIRFQSNDLPRGNPAGYAVDIFRERVELDANGAILRRSPSTEWRRITATGAHIGAMTFTRSDKSTFTGAQLMSDLALAFDVLAQETP